jgi:hypothetical protein
MVEIDRVRARDVVVLLSIWPRLVFCKRKHILAKEFLYDLQVVHPYLGREPDYLRASRFSGSGRSDQQGSARAGRKPF